MLHLYLAGLVLAVSATPVQARSDLVATGLYGKSCKLVDAGKRGASTRLCNGVGGYAVLVHENQGRTSIDIVAPNAQTYQLDYWDVITPDLSHVGRMAEWQLIKTKGKPQPVALLVRLNTLDQRSPYYARQDTVLTVARIESDGACVIFKVDARAKNADAQAREAAADPDRKCLGAYTAAAE